MVVLEMTCGDDTVVDIEVRLMDFEEGVFLNNVILEYY